MFIDEVEIEVISGKGGDGVVHFRREKFVPRGGPDGGDGGKGGDVIFRVDPNMNTLSSFRHKSIFRAKDGLRGGKQNQTGRSGENLIISVPPGTVVYDVASGDVLGDLVENNQRIIIVAGGRGGRGNTRFASSVRQAPRVAERGEPGEQKRLHLELKLIADIGIIGAPNAGKSTFLSVVTNAKPKIASYPFTTLEPNLGVSDLDYETSLVLADIPGLIEGAHMGVGLGHDFLRHIQRTRVLIHLLDGMAEDPVLDFVQINSELALFDPALALKPQIVAFNKMDLDSVQERWPQIEGKIIELINDDRGGVNIHSPVMAISAVARKHVRELLYRAAQILDELPEVQENTRLPLYRVVSDPNDYSISQTENGWRVSGEAIERAAAMTYWENFESVRRFARILEALGIDQALKEAGIHEGDTVFISEYELEWKD